jgi:5'-3' exonuclease
VVLIVDGNNMAYRALHTLSLSHRGKDTSITFGVLKMLEGLMKAHGPRSIIVCWDGGKSYRKRLYPEYKEHRTKDERDWDDVYRQMDELADYALPMLGILSVKAVGIEADDLIAQAARMCADRPYIVSTDDDFLQCVDNRVSVINPVKGTIITADNFEKETKVPLGFYLIYKILVGDSSDNIPGVRGIGPKTASTFVKELQLLCSKDMRGDYIDPRAVTYGFIIRDMIRWTLDKGQEAALTKLGSKMWDLYHDLMDLSVDRVGAAAALFGASLVPYRDNEKAVRQYYFNNGFISLQPSLFKNLEKPSLIDNLRYSVRVERQRG